MSELAMPAVTLCWQDLSEEVCESLAGKLVGLWGAANDADAFASLSADKQQALLLILRRLRVKNIWSLVRKIDNVYGHGGVGIYFTAWPFIESTLSRRKDFTRLFANHKDTSGGFCEKGRAKAVLHFLCQERSLLQWHVHFDLYSPVHSPGSAMKHLRYEYLGKVKPDWRMIHESLKA